MKTDALNKFTEKKIIDAVFSVHSRWGLGFVEKVYENALAIEPRNSGLAFETQKQIKVLVVGDFFLPMF